MIITVSLGKHPLPHFGFFHHFPQLQPFPAPTLNPIPPLWLSPCVLYTCSLMNYAAWRSHTKRVHTVWFNLYNIKKIWNYWYWKKLDHKLLKGRSKRFLRCARKIWGWWTCSASWLWWKFHGYIHMSNFIELYTADLCGILDFNNNFLNLWKREIFLLVSGIFNDAPWRSSKLNKRGRTKMAA